MSLDFSVVPQYLPMLLQGAWMTLQLSVLGTVLGLVLGLMAAMAKLSGLWPLRLIADFYIWVFRGTPLLVQLFVIYYGLPQLGVEINAWMAAFIGLGLNGGAYMAEVYRASILAVPRGQSEAALSLGMSDSMAFRQIIMPQALKIAIPSLGNQGIILLKDSSLASVIAISELLLVARRFGSRHFAFLEFFLAAAAIYLVMTTLFTFVTNYYERHFNKEGSARV